MLERILETEVMGSAAEAVDYDAMDHQHVNQIFVSDLLQWHAEFATILDVGTGTAQIPIELCHRQPHTRVVAIDMSEEMLRVGQCNLHRAGLTERVQLQHCDAKRLPFASDSLEALMSNSIVHHIPVPLVVIAEMVRVVKPGGMLFVRDLMRPVDQVALETIVTQYAGEANPHQQQMYADSLHAALTVEEMRALVVGLGFEASTVQASSDRHWTWAALKPGRG